MPINLSKIMKRKQEASGATPTIHEYEESFGMAKDGALENEENPDRKVSNLYYDLVTDFYDAVYSIEATCHAPDKLAIYGEVFRLLKPGACFGAYEYCLTDRFDANNPHHLQVMADVELGTGILDIPVLQTVDDALRSVGFEVLETRDLSVQTGPSIPWYQPLVGSGLSLASFRSSRVGRWVTHNTLRALETLHLAPKGTVRVSETLNLCAAAMAEAGRLAILTPMYFIHARKPA